MGDVLSSKKRLRLLFGNTAAITALALIVPLAAQNRSPVAPAEQRLKTAVNEAYAMYKDDPAGKNADYIPYLAHVNRNLFGIAVVTTDNKCYMLGDTTYSFSIQSISKVFTLALAMEEHGAAAVFQKIGSEPTGRPFNSVIAVVDMPTHTRESAGECRGYSKRRV